MVNGLSGYRLEAKLLTELLGFLNSGEPKDINCVLRQKFGRVLVLARAKLGGFKPDLIFLLPLIEADCAKLKLAQKLLVACLGCLCVQFNLLD